MFTLIEMAMTGSVKLSLINKKLHALQTPEERERMRMIKGKY